MNLKPSFPLSNDENLIDTFVGRLKYFPIFCPICGSYTYIWNINRKNYRETCICKKCGSTNRNRQMAIILCNHFSNSYNVKIKSLKDIKKIKNIKILNTETRGPLHNILKNTKGYICSEYINKKYISGKKYNGILHEDLNSTSFNNNYFDVVITSDVFEHIPEPYNAFKEIYRILKPGGTHIFTVPFNQSEFLDDIRTRVVNGKEKKYKAPIYHLDPIRKDGIIVYTIFSMEMLVKLSKMGFKNKMFKIHNIKNGIIGNNSIIFESTRQ